MDYIYKPFSMEEVRAKIESVIRNCQKITEMNRKKLSEKIKSVMYTDNGVVPSITFEDICMQYQLSRRERDVVTLAMEGKQIEGIAKRLGLSVHTVRNHTRYIYKKCGVNNRVELLNVFRG